MHDDEEFDVDGATDEDDRDEALDDVREETFSAGVSEGESPVIGIGSRRE